MDARCAEIYSMASNAKTNVDAISDAYNDAIDSGLADNKFRTVTNPILDRIEDITMHAAHVKEKLEKKEPVIRLDEEMAFGAFVNSQIVLRQTQEAVAAAVERKKARDEEAKAEESARKKARNKPGGSNA